MSTTGIAVRRAGFAALSWAIAACGDAGVFVEVHLEASHARPAEVREIWSTRFRNARDRELLAIVRAEARLAPPGLVLDATVRVPACDAAIAEATRQAVADLTTGQHRLAVHRVDPVAVERLADRLRATLGLDVRTPRERPGQLVAAAPAERLLALAPADAGARFVVERSSPEETVLWAVAPTPALTGASVATTGVDLDGARAAIELTFNDEGAATMRDLSEAARGEPLVFLVDDAFALAPTVVVRVSHTLRLELPPGHTAQASALARAIAASNLPEAPVLRSSEAHCAAR